VLAALLLAHGRVVSTDRLIDAVWGDDVPGSATASLQAYISNLRKALRAHSGAASSIVRQAPGYYLDASASDVDLIVFTDHCAVAAVAIDAGWRTCVTKIGCGRNRPGPGTVARAGGLAAYTGVDWRRRGVFTCDGSSAYRTFR
jgi:hypothetical protein